MLLHSSPSSPISAACPTIEALLLTILPFLSDMLESARHDSDLLITTGGASKGERDLVKGVLKDLGAKFLFEQVAMRPGKPFGFAMWHGKPVCVFPGSPAAAFVCFQELIRPAMARLAGRHATNLPVVLACRAPYMRVRNAGISFWPGSI